jgi:hypothetical protein
MYKITPLMNIPNKPDKKKLFESVEKWNEKYATGECTWAEAMWAISALKAHYQSALTAHEMERRMYESF